MQIAETEIHIDLEYGTFAFCTGMKIKITDETEISKIPRNLKTSGKSNLKGK